MPRNVILSFIVFLACCAIGLTLSSRNPIENDESYSQHESTQNLSYIDILQGKVREGNNCPLFYVLQKAFGQIIGFNLKTRWVTEQFVCEDNAQWIMRLLPVLFMSAAMALCFYYFIRRYNLFAAIIILLLFLTSHMIWIYWAQNRPYSLWILLTSAQTILLIEYFVFKNETRKFWTVLGVTHWLLCLCSGFGLIQTLLALLFIRKKWFFIFIAPALIGVMYAMLTPKYPFRVPTEWMSLIFSNLSLERLVFLAVGAFFLKKFMPLSLWLCGLVGIGITLIVAIYLQHTTGNAGFELSARYLLFLLPASIIVLNLYLQEMIKTHQKNPLVLLALIQAVFFIIMMGAWRTFVVLQRLL